MKIRFTDRLRDRGFVDQWGFAFFAVAGSLLIFAAKWIGLNAGWVAGGAMAAMVAYAVIVARKGSGRLAADQAGDNCYYLGLIYTLTSLSYAIIFFDPNDTATTIVQGFGVALASTIAGLVLRVFFNQGRPDLENFEEQARLELTEAASTLTTEIGQVTLGMKDFSLRFQQSLGEMGLAGADQITQFTDASVTGLKNAVNTADEAIRSQANDFSQRSKRYSASFDKLLEKLEAQAEKIEIINNSHEKVFETAAQMEETSRMARESILAFVEGSKANNEVLRATVSHSTQIREALAALERLIAGYGNQVSDFQTSVASQLDEMRSAPGKTINESSAAIEKSAQRMNEIVDGLAATHERVMQEMAGQTQAALGASKNHNDQIEIELEKSRSLYGRMFDGMLSITDELAKKANGGN